MIRLIGATIYNRGSIVGKLGRETNIVQRTTNSVDGVRSEITAYPDGVSEYSYAVDLARNTTYRSIHRYSDHSQETVYRYRNDWTLVGIETTERYHNGRTLSEKSADALGTRCDNRFIRYADDGRRLEIAETTAAGICTTNVTEYDLLGRVQRVVSPLGVASNFYFGSSTRLWKTAQTGSPDVEYFYNAAGDVAAIKQGIVYSHTCTGYETIDGLVWKVSRQFQSAGGITNTLSITREQLTGLAPEFRGMHDHDLPDFRRHQYRDVRPEHPHRNADDDRCRRGRSVRKNILRTDVRERFIQRRSSLCLQHLRRSHGRNGHPFGQYDEHGQADRLRCRRTRRHQRNGLCIAYRDGESGV